MAEHSNEVTANLERADVSLQAAKELLEKSYHDIAASAPITRRSMLPAPCCWVRTLIPASIVE
jgi:hypothetical protein